ncbi:MAG: VTT domain-containing protein [Cyclobacteriaceae bacterium]
MSKEGSQKQSRWPLYLSIMLVASLMLLYFFNSDVNQFFQEAWEILSSGNEERIAQWVEQFSWWGPMVIIFVMVAQMFLLVIPSVVVMVVSIIAYGPVFGTLIILMSIFCASSIGYAIGKSLGTPIIDRIVGAKSERKIEGFLVDYGFWAVIITRISPFLSNDAISFVAGILRMGYWRFIGATLLGILPLTLLIAFLGESNDRLKTGLLWVSIISLIGFVLYVWWDRKRVKNEH